MGGLSLVHLASKNCETYVYLPVYGPTNQETPLDWSRGVDEARSTSLSVQCRPGSDISTCPLAPASAFLKKWPSGKYILISSSLNRQADFLSSPHIFI